MLRDWRDKDGESNPGFYVEALFVGLMVAAGLIGLATWFWGQITG